MTKLTVPKDERLARLFEWLDTEEGMISAKANENVAEALQGAALDVKERRIVWPDGRRLTIDQTVRRIRKKTVIDFHVIETHVMCWMEMRFAPKGLSRKQMETFEIQLSQWIEDHKRERSK